MTKIFLIFSLFTLWLPNVSADGLPTPRWVTSKNTINCRASYITDEDGKAMGSIKYQYVKKYFPWEVVRNIDDLWVQARDPLTDDLCFLFRPILSPKRAAITKEAVLGYNNPIEKKVVAKVEKNVHGMILKADSAFILFEVYLEEEGKKSKFYIPKNKVFGIYPNEIIN